MKACKARKKMKAQKARDFFKAQKKQRHVLAHSLIYSRLTISYKKVIFH